MRYVWVSQTFKKAQKSLFFGATWLNSHIVATALQYVFYPFVSNLFTKRQFIRLLAAALHINRANIRKRKILRSMTLTKCRVMPPLRSLWTVVCTRTSTLAQFPTLIFLVLLPIFAQWLSFYYAIYVCSSYICPNSRVSWNFHHLRMNVWKCIFTFTVMTIVHYFETDKNY